MKQPRIQDIEKFILTIEEGIEDLKCGIDTLERYGSRMGGVDFSKVILERKKKEMEDDLERFREMDTAELVRTGFAGFDRLIAYSEINKD